MSNKTQLQTNNTNLDAIIARVNAAKNTAASLPEAGSGGSGGGSVETCTVTSTATTNNKSVYYTEGSGNLQNVTMSINEVATFTVLKNTIMYVNNASTVSVSGDCTTLFNTMGKGIFVISGDCTISF